MKFRSRIVATIILLQLLAICAQAQSPRAPVRGWLAGGSTTAEITVVGAIGEKWRAMGAGNSPLKQPVANEQPTFDGVGRSQQFQGGIISWHPSTGAHVVWGLIGKLWLQLGREQFGYPITDELPARTKGGLYNHFRALHLPNHPESSIFWSRHTDAHVVYGAIRDLWATLDWDAGRLGFPTSDEYEDQAEGIKYRRSDFQHGKILWRPNGRAKAYFNATY
jgi:uncharacterized protein with LGFP repeats